MMIYSKLIARYLLYCETSEKFIKEISYKHYLDMKHKQ